MSEIDLKPVCSLAVSLLLTSGYGVAFMQGAGGVPEQQPTVWDAVYTTDQADRGAVVYGKECASCHGDGLTGIDEAPALVGSTFLSNWNGQTVGDLVDLTRKSMPKDSENTLTRQQYVDVTTHVLRANGFPAGTTELLQSPLRLGTIRIDAFKAAEP
jgi:quinoprotein glucose dehydrogenase